MTWCADLDGRPGQRSANGTLETGDAARQVAVKSDNLQLEVEEGARYIDPLEQARVAGREGGVQKRALPSPRLGRRL